MKWSRVIAGNSWFGSIEACCALSEDGPYIVAVRRQVVTKMTREEVLKKLEENRETIRGFGVRRLGIFGSYARGEQNEASDIDFLVDFDDATLRNYLNLKDFLGGLFGCPVDLVFADTVKPRLRPIIFNEVVYARGL